MELWEYLEVLLRWSWVIVLVTALCTAAALGFIQVQTPRYTSLVEITVRPARLDLQLSQTTINLLRNYVSSIESEGMARRVIERLGLSGLTPAQLSEKIDGDAEEAEFKIMIEVTDPDPLVAQRLAQAVAQLFVEDVQAFAQRQDPRDRLTATMLNGDGQHPHAPADARQRLDARAPRTPRSAAPHRTVVASLASGARTSPR
jgi:capsular polysaccharide biosynthesis protein